MSGFTLLNITPHSNSVTFCLLRKHVLISERSLTLFRFVTFLGQVNSCWPIPLIQGECTEVLHPRSKKSSSSHRPHNLSFSSIGAFLTNLLRKEFSNSGIKVIAL